MGCWEEVFVEALWEKQEEISNKIAARHEMAIRRKGNGEHFRITAVAKYYLFRS
jgi:hypothetical protein